MTSSKVDRTLFAELGGLVTLVPHPRKGFRHHPGMGPGAPSPWELSLSPQAQDGGIGPSRGFVPFPHPALLGSSQETAGRESCVL